MRTRTITASVVLGAAVIAAGASADFRSVNDPRGDTKCGHETGQHGACSAKSRRNADIVRATAGHGKKQPVAPNTLPNGADNPEGRAKNRRIEMFLIKR